MNKCDVCDEPGEMEMSETSGGERRSSDDDDVRVELVT